MAPPTRVSSVYIVISMSRPIDETVVGGSCERRTLIGISYRGATESQGIKAPECHRYHGLSFPLDIAS